MDKLYQERILAFARATRGMEPLDDHTHEASVSNPTCGDRVDIRLKIENGTVIAASAAIRGCALCEAGAGLLTQIAPQLNAVPGESVEDIGRVDHNVAREHAEGFYLVSWTLAELLTSDDHLGALLGACATDTDTSN